MNIRSNKFNDPALGQAFANIASIFAPPSAQDLVGYSTAKAKKEEAERLSWLFANPNDPLADRKATMAGVYNPTQSYYAQDQNTATARRGQDVTASTSITNNQADNARALEQTRTQGQFGLAEQFITPRAEGTVDPGIPGGLADFFGLPAMDPVNGAKKPLSETEWMAGEQARLQESGQLTDQMLVESFAGDQTPVKVLGPDGKTPVFSTPGAAALSGAAAFIDAGSQPKPENATAVLPDGSQVPAVQDPTTGRWEHAQTGAPLPADIRVVKMAAPTGSNADVGIGKTNQSRVDGQAIGAIGALDTLNQLEPLIMNSPASQGLVGSLRGTAQDVMQTGTEIGRFFGGTVAEVTEAVNGGLIDSALATEMYDPSIPAIDLLSNALAWQYGKSFAGDRLSNEQLKMAREAVGASGTWNNQAKSLARLKELRGMFNRDLTRMAPVLSPDVNKLAAPFLGAPPPAGAGGEMPVVNSPEEAAALPSGTRFKTPDGRIKVVP